MLLRTFLVAAATFLQSFAQDITADTSGFEAAAPGIDERGNVVDAATGNRTGSVFNQKVCPEVPLMPQRFILRRNFWGLRNTIEVRDRKGVLILTLRTKWFEWGHLDRAWRFSGANLYKEKEGALKRGWGLNAFQTSDHEFMGSSSGIPYDLEIKDCNGVVTSKTGNVNQIYSDAGMLNRAGFFTITTREPESNEAVIFGLGTDAEALVKFEQREPCWLWPMCTSLPDRGWLALAPWVAREWTGEVLQKGYGQQLGQFETGSKVDGDGFSENMGANAATDMKFLALWSLHVFGATKFSPAQQWLMGLTSLFLMTYCCAHCCFPKKEPARILPVEEEVYASSYPDGSMKYSSPWNCCSRQKQSASYARTIQGYSVSALQSEMKKMKASQKEIDECLDTADPKASLVDTLTAKKETMMTRGALE